VLPLSNVRQPKPQDFAKEYPEIIAWFDKSGIKSAKPFAFAVSPQEALIKYGSLTDNQIAAARRRVANYQAAVEANQARRHNAKEVNVEALTAAFDKASDELRNPSLRIGQLTVSKKLTP
jgi:hypothetical protein